MEMLYIHIPKTGGTSIKEVLKNTNLITENSEVIKRHPLFHKNHLPVMNFKMSNAERFRGILGTERWAAAWKVAFVRNPWDRYVSNWKWLTRKEKLYPRKGWQARGWKGSDGQVSFDNFVKQIAQCYIEIDRLHGYQHDKWHIRNQVDHIVDDQNNIMVDYVARYENIDEEFSLICKKAGLNLTLPHLNHTGHYSGEPKEHEPKRVHYSSYYTPELVEIVRGRCRTDIEAFGYEYEDQNG